MKLIRSFISAVAVSAVLVSGSAHAALTSFQTFVGSFGVSTDGWGSNSTGPGIISANVPVGATVRAAYLYTSAYSFYTLGDVGGTLNGSVVDYATNLGSNLGEDTFSLTAFRADVTSIIKPLIDGGPGGVYDFTITETNFDNVDGSAQDGSALVVVYEQASLPESTVAILDGYALVTGDSTTINFAEPPNPAAPDFFAEMRLGIGYSYDGIDCTLSDQSSTVAVNDTLITTSAGCNDDSTDGAENGNLITVGGFDDPFSPLLPAIADDHERYDLTPYVVLGDTSININTFNSSEDDHVFLAVFHVAGRASVNEVPEPMPLSLLGLVFAALIWQRKTMGKSA